MMVYRDMDIGTAKPSMQERDGVPHHLIDVVDIDEPYDVSRYSADAEAAMEDILSRSRRIVLCGGTGLYAKAVLQGFGFRPTDPAIREAVEELYKESGATALVTELASAGTADDIVTRLAKNPRRLMRAVEVLRLSGSLSDAKATENVALQIILMPPPELSRSRISERTRQMFEAGWIEETKKLVDAGLLDSPTAKQAMGYKLIADFIAGRGSLATIDELQSQIVTATCRYAKRQRTWFRHQHPGAHILPIEPLDTVESITAKAVELAANPNGR
jgi:tRNA dimethylallyltransferase